MRAQLRARGVGRCLVAVRGGTDKIIVAEAQAPKQGLKALAQIVHVRLRKVANAGPDNFVVNGSVWASGGGGRAARKCHWAAVQQAGQWVQQECPGKARKSSSVTDARIRKSTLQATGRSSC